MDVLTAHTLTVTPIRMRGEQDCLVQLLEYLGAERRKYAGKLHAEIARTDSRLRRDLERNLNRVDKFLHQAEEHPSDSDAMPAMLAKAIKLSSELNSPPRLSRSSLHAYRLKVKELRDVLQLLDRAEDKGFLKELGNVKDAIGEWHDWQVLTSIAARLLDHGRSCKVMKYLRKTGDSKYEDALALAKRLRSRYLKPRLVVGAVYDRA
jgi:CHAD domain-containing protein